MQTKKVTDLLMMEGNNLDEMKSNLMEKEDTIESTKLLEDFLTDLKLYVEKNPSSTSLNIDLDTLTSYSPNTFNVDSLNTGTKFSINVGIQKLPNKFGVLTFSICDIEISVRDSHSVPLVSKYSFYDYINEFIFRGNYDYHFKSAVKNNLFKVNWENESVYAHIFELLSSVSSNSFDILVKRTVLGEEGYEKFNPQINDNGVLTITKDDKKFSIVSNSVESSVSVFNSGTFITLKSIPTPNELEKMVNRLLLDVEDKISIADEYHIVKTLDNLLNNGSTMDSLKYDIEYMEGKFKQDGNKLFYQVTDNLTIIIFPKSKFQIILNGTFSEDFYSKLMLEQILIKLNEKNLI